MHKNGNGKNGSNGKGKGGRPKEKPGDKVDLRQVSLLAKWGHTDAEMAMFFGVHVDTISYWKKDAEFFQALKNGKRDADGYVQRSLYKNARRGNVTAQIFWLKNRQPETWRDAYRHEGSLTMTHKANDLSDEDLMKIAVTWMKRSVKDDESSHYHA